MEHVIVGAGPAGVVAAETLRKIDSSATISIIGDEHEPPYSRMALPYYLIKKIDEKGTYLRRADSHYQDKGINLVRDRVSIVNTETKRLVLEQGGTVNFDKLLIATGSHPISPPISGIDLPGVHPCWTLEDARNIAKKARQDANVVLLGAGFIGCIILEALASRRVNLTVVEMEGHMVPRMLNRTSGELIKKWCEAKGITVHTSKKVESIEQAELGSNLLKVKLDGGEMLDANIVVAATGVEPNIKLLDGSGIECKFGVLVDDHLQSNHPDVYAAGDVCQGKDFSTGEFNVQAIQPTAVDHGRVAAMNMAGKNAVHQGSLNLNVLDTMGLVSTSYGLWMGIDGGDSAELCDEANYRYINLQFEEDTLIGAQALGLTEHIGVLRGLIQAKLKLGKWKKYLLEDPTRIMEAYLGTTQAVGHNAGLI